MKTLLLDRTTWDLCLDAKGNIAVADNTYSIIQDVASAIRLFKGELWYDTTKGVPHLEQILGHHPSLSVLKALLESAALTVPETKTAVVFVSDTRNREIHGQVQVTTTDGTVVVVGGQLSSPTPV